MREADSYFELLVSSRKDKNYFIIILRNPNQERKKYD